MIGELPKRIRVQKRSSGQFWRNELATTASRPETFDKLFMAYRHYKSIQIYIIPLNIPD